MIQGFRDRATERFWHGERVRQFEPFAAQAFRKLDMLNTASVLADLKVPPGNQLEPLSGDRKGQHSIRINRQWRVCFIWREGGPDHVEICDYH
jgi:proteic killer suppression protein